MALTRIEWHADDFVHMYVLLQSTAARLFGYQSVR